ncbi:MAG TPA: NAD(P)H-dependent oxidoreductase [Thermomicrobiales bacterium]|jgi:FMN reductase
MTVTPSPVRILGIGGSTRRGSMSLLALKTALRLAEEQGAQTSLAAVRDLDLPLYNGERHLSDYPTTLHWFLDEVRAADGLVICSPTYHGTVSGAVKNALDSLEFLANDQPGYLAGKSVALLGYGGASAMNTINALYHTVRALSAHVVPTVAILSRDQLDAEQVDIREAGVRQRTATMMREVIDLGRLIRDQRQRA